MAAFMLVCMWLAAVSLLLLLFVAVACHAATWGFLLCSCCA